MIDHSKCDHEKTRAARAKCRRSSGDGSTPKKARATPKDVDLSESGGSSSRGQTPTQRSDECHVCGVEMIRYSGTDAWTNIKVYVGEKCLWRIKRSPDLRELRP